MKLFFRTVTLIFLVLTATGFAEVIEHNLPFNKADLLVTKIGQYDVVTMKNLELTFEMSAPQLPCKIINLPISSRKKVSGVEIISAAHELLPQEFYIFPCQPPQVLSAAQSQLKMTEPAKEFYASTSPYPKETVKFLGTGTFQGQHLANFAIYPLQYFPVEKKIKFYSEIRFRVLLEDSIAAPKPVVSERNKEYLRLIEKIDLNLKPEEISNDEQFPYLIITNKLAKNYFQPLADWKTQKGVRAKLVDVNWIKSQNFEGRDDAEMVRNFIRYAYQTWGTKWVLLAGDTNLIPHRIAFAMDCQFSSQWDENHIPCDLYFSALDGNWDANGNGIFGELDDEVDLYPEVYVGRAALDTPEEITGWVNKVLAYEKNPPLDFQKNILFLCQILWSMPYTDTGIGKNKIESQNLPANFFNVTKLYQSSGNLEKDVAVRKINQGQNLINHDGHAWWSLMSMGQSSLSVTDMFSLANGQRAGTIFSIGCWAAAIDYDCVAEAFIANPNGGGVAFIGNSRYGWGSPGNPGFGYSDRFDDKFFYFLFKEQCFSIGQAMGLAKAYYAPFSLQKNVYRWCLYEINLLGDPEMPIWTDIPKQMSVTFPDSISVGNNFISITVTHGNSPVENARVCLKQAETVYRTGTTSSQGQAQFSLSTENAAEKIQLTVTAQNYLPYQGTITVKSQAPYLACSSIIIDDANGNGDGVLNPGETAFLSLRIKNYGTAPAETLLISLVSDSSKITVLKDKIAVESINGSDSLVVDKTFQISADLSCVNSEVFYLQLVMNAHLARWSEKVPITVGAPEIEWHKMVIKDKNGRPLLKAGDEAKVLVYLQNQGLAVAPNVQAKVSSSDQFLTLSESALSFGDMSPHQIAADSLVISVSATCPEPYFPTLLLQGSHETQGIFSKNIVIPIGTLGFYDDLESDVANWELTDVTKNSWHISSIRSHSGMRSWYCGNETDTSYSDNNKSVLISPHFYLGMNADISFYLWYDVAIYSKGGYEGDGVHVDFFDGSTWQELDFIGTGGALQPALMGNDWLEYKYHVPDCPPTNLARLKFTFVSDPFWDRYPTRYEGIYLDDIKVKCNAASAVIQTDVVTYPDHFVLAQNYPNPFNGMTTIKYQISSNDRLSPISLDDYNIFGQKVKTLVRSEATPGYFQVVWDGTNEAGQSVASGIYFYRMKVKDQFREMKKLILLK